MSSDFPIYPTFGASGASSSRGLVPDPGPSAGASKFLREDASWTAAPVTSVAGRAGAIVLAESDVAGLVADLASKIPAASAGAANGIATLDSSGKLAGSQIPAALVGALVYQGTWNASANTPTLVSGTGTKGNYFKVSVAGTTTVDGHNQWNVGDTIVFDGATWDKIDGIANEIVSWNGLTGVISATTTNLPEGSNQYFTNLRALTATSGAYLSLADGGTVAGPIRAVALAGALGQITIDSPADVDQANLALSLGGNRYWAIYVPGIGSIDAGALKFFADPGQGGVGDVGGVDQMGNWFWESHKGTLNAARIDFGDDGTGNISYRFNGETVCANDGSGTGGGTWNLDSGTVTNVAQINGPGDQVGWFTAGGPMYLRGGTLNFNDGSTSGGGIAKFDGALLQNIGLDATDPSTSLQNSQMQTSLPDNTHLKIWVKGNDGVVRAAVLPLA